MKIKLNNLYFRLFELEKKYQLSVNELDQYLEIKNEIKIIRQKIEFGME